MQMGSKCKQRELNPNLVEPKASYHVKSPIVQKVKLFGKGPTMYIKLSNSDAQTSLAGRLSGASKPWPNFRAPR